MKGRTVEQRNLMYYLGLVDARHLLQKGDEYCFSTLFPLDVINKMLVKAGFDAINQDEFKINGWQVDFSCPLHHPKLGEFILTGSLFFGDYRITKD